MKAQQEKHEEYHEEHRAEVVDGRLEDKLQEQTLLYHHDFQRIGFESLSLVVGVHAELADERFQLFRAVLANEYLFELVVFCADPLGLADWACEMELDDHVFSVRLVFLEIAAERGPESVIIVRKAPFKIRVGKFIDIFS